MVRPLHVTVPWPGISRTRATEVLRLRCRCRRPCPQPTSRSFLQSRERRRLLRVVRMRGSGVHLELAKLCAADAVLRQHAADGVPDDLFGPAGELLGQRSLLDAARIAGVAVVDLLLELVARHADALAVD